MTPHLKSRYNDIFRIVDRPRLDALMELYASNYALLLQLVPTVRDMQGKQTSQLAQALDLHLDILEQSPFTTRLGLTWEFGSAEAADLDAQPDFAIRLSHDACAAEVLSFSGPGGEKVGDNSLGVSTCRVYSTLDWKWQINNFFHKWLRFCLDEGHCFDGREHPGRRPKKLPETEAS